MTRVATTPLVGQREMRSPLAALRDAAGSGQADAAPVPEAVTWHGTDRGPRPLAKPSGSVNDGVIRPAVGNVTAPRRYSSSVVRVRPAPAAATGVSSGSAPKAPVQRLMAPVRPAASTPLPVVPAGPQWAPAQPSAAVQRSVDTVVQLREAPPAPSGSQRAGTQRAGTQRAGIARAAAPPVRTRQVDSLSAGAPPGRTPLAGADLDEIVGLVTRRLRAEFRIDRERFGRLRDSTR